MADGFQQGIDEMLTAAISTDDSSDAVPLEFHSKGPAQVDEGADLFPALPRRQECLDEGPCIAAGRRQIKITVR